SSISAPTFPCTWNRPVVGTVTRDRILRIVLLPDPFEPISSTGDVEADVAERPDLFPRARAAAQHQGQPPRLVPDGAGPSSPEPVPLRDALEPDRRVRHGAPAQLR